MIGIGNGVGVGLFGSVGFVGCGVGRTGTGYG